MLGIKKFIFLLIEKGFHLFLFFYIIIDKDSQKERECLNGLLIHCPGFCHLLLDRDIHFEKRDKIVPTIIKGHYFYLKKSLFSRNLFDFIAILH